MGNQYDSLLARLRQKDRGVDSRLSSIEEILAILTPGGLPISGIYSFGDWTPAYEQVIEFAAWAA